MLRKLYSLFLLVLSHALYPAVFEEYKTFQHEFGDLSALETRAFLTGMQTGQELEVFMAEGNHLVVKLLATSDPDENGFVTVYFELNGAPRQVKVQDESVEAAKASHAKADSRREGSVGSPMPGVVVEVQAHKGDHVKQGEPLITLNGMKMEMTIVAPVEGVVTLMDTSKGEEVEAGDLLVEIQED